RGTEETAREFRHENLLVACSWGVFMVNTQSKGENEMSGRWVSSGRHSMPSARTRPRAQRVRRGVCPHRFRRCNGNAPRWRRARTRGRRASARDSANAAWSVAIGNRSREPSPGAGGSFAVGYAHVRQAVDPGVTQLLAACADDDADLLARVFPLVYEELKQIA